MLIYIFKGVIPFFIKLILQDNDINLDLAVEKHVTPNSQTLVDLNYHIIIILLFLWKSN